jgi:hypothetical protein
MSDNVGLMAASAAGMLALLFLWKDFGRDRITVVLAAGESSFWDSYASGMRDSFRAMRLPAAVHRVGDPREARVRPEAGTLLASNVPGWGVDLAGLLCLGAVAIPEAGNIVTPAGYGLSPREFASAVRHAGSSVNAPESIVDGARTVYYLDCVPGRKEGRPLGVMVRVPDFARTQGRMAAVWLRSRHLREPLPEEAPRAAKKPARDP